MNLKSGCILWPDIYREPAISYPPLANDVQCDVAIIGGGISGALAAYHLTRHGIHAVLVDRRPIAHGSTAASTGLLQYEIDTPLVELIDKVGRDRAAAAYRASAAAVSAFQPIVDDLSDRCGLIPRPSLYLASTEKDAESLRAECDARREIGLDVQFLSASALRDRTDISRRAALWSPGAFEVDPFRLTLALIARSVQRGLQVFTDVQVSGSEPRQNGIALLTTVGPRIEAKKIVIATGYETMEFLPRDLCKLASTYAIASQPVVNFEPWPEHCLIWESARPYLYLRTTEDNRIIVGGEDIDVVAPEPRDQLLPQKTQTLIHRFTRLIPRIPIEAEYAWAGAFASTDDGLPYIGTFKQMPHAYFALGYGGNGITFSLLAARIITDAFLGQTNPWANLFGFDR